jgi:hypothetical protein
VKQTTKAPFSAESGGVQRHEENTTEYADERKRLRNCFGLKQQKEHRLRHGPLGLVCKPGYGCRLPSRNHDSPVAGESLRSQLCQNRPTV